MSWQQNACHDGAVRLPFLIGDLLEARNVDIGMFLLDRADKMAIRAQTRCQLLATSRIGLARDRTGDGEAGPA